MPIGVPNKIASENQIVSILVKYFVLEFPTPHVVNYNNLLTLKIKPIDTSCYATKRTTSNCR